MNNDGRITDPENRVIADDYLEVGDRDRIIDDNERRLTDNDHMINGNRVTRHENDNIINDHDAIDRSAVKHMSDETKDDLNADMITGEPGSHPVGTGVGGVGGAAAGLALGAMAGPAAGAALGTVTAGPLGTLIGGAIGAIVGAGAGHAAAEAMNPTHEEAYWRAEHAKADYYKEGYDFDRDLHPAYAVGYANRARYPADARFEDHEADLERSWNEVKGESRMEWRDARRASADAWNRVS